MSRPGDLTTLAAVQAWLAAPTSGGPGDSDAVLTSLITTCSAAIMGFLQRASLLSQTFTDVFDGKGNHAFFLQEWPVTSVTSVTVNGQSIPQSPDGIMRGWVLQPWNGYPPGSPQSVQLVGGACFWRGRQNISITYVAGYETIKEAQVVPATPYQVTVNQPLGNWAKDGGVTYANGTALTLVTGTPAIGQYALLTAPGAYQFAAADTGANVLISYSYVPYAVAEAAMEFVGERYRYRGRIGEKSRSMGGQTTAAYDMSDIPAYIRLQLQPYRKVLPI